jgi:nitrate/TMAO reductase-like tetraheme cytochrome c subunit
VTCHHASKPEKALTKEHQACADCHTTPEATAPMKTSLKMAMHNTAEKTGTCVSCHQKAAAEGKTVPEKCSDCHVKKESQ